MANVPPGQPIAPGIAPANAGYPQYGVMMSGSSGTIKEAVNAAEKTADLNAGYLTWFTSKAAAQEFISSETSALSGNVNAPYLGALTDIVKYPAAIAAWIANRGNWMRILKVIVGGALILMGASQLKAVKNAENVAVNLGTKVAGAAAIA